MTISSFAAEALGEDLAARARHEALAPEFNARPTRRLLAADPVAGGHVAAVRDGVRALDRLPGLVLGLPELLLLARVPADRRRVEDDLGPLQGRQARGLRVPLVPANQDADPAELGLP